MGTSTVIPVMLVVLLMGGRGRLPSNMVVLVLACLGGEKMVRKCGEKVREKEWSEIGVVRERDKRRWEEGLRANLGRCLRAPGPMKSTSRFVFYLYYLFIFFISS